MAFNAFAENLQGIELLQRSLEHGRLAHGYIFKGNEQSFLESLARTLAKTLNCENPVRRGGAAIDCCEQCLSCQKINHDNHADVFWIRPESKSRVIRIPQIVRRDESPPRVLLEFVNLKPTESQYKVGIIVGADRMNENAANAFLKTLEEPPAKSILILLTTEPERILETILSRCLQLNFSGAGQKPLAPAEMTWLANFSQVAASEEKSMLGRYRLIDALLKKLNGLKAGIEEAVTARSPLEQHKDVEKNLRDRWEDELKAAVESEYRRERADVLGLIHWWLRDVWLRTLAPDIDNAGANNCKEGLLRFPELTETERVAQRISARQALENLQVFEQLQRRLHSNVQEALALEVGFLKLRL